MQDFVSRVNYSIIFYILLLFIQTGCFTQENIKDPYTWDSGQVKQGEVLKHTFVLKNKSLKTINIEQVNTSCGCTTSEVKKTNLKPQESTEIEVKFDTKNYSGEVKQFIYIHTDDLDNPIIRFTIKAEVVK